MQTRLQCCLPAVLVESWRRCTTSKTEGMQTRGLANLLSVVACLLDAGGQAPDVLSSICEYFVLLVDFRGLLIGARGGSVDKILSRADARACGNLCCNPVAWLCSR
jgi:hypothetical protein